jgi:hypothetical protein
LHHGITTLDYSMLVGLTTHACNRWLQGLPGIAVPRACGAPG